MKTQTTNRKNNFLKLTKFLVIGALMSLGLKANAQTADFTYVVDLSNNGDVTFTNTSTPFSPSYDYHWDFGGLGTPHDFYEYTPSFIFTYNASGDYTVSLQINDSTDHTPLDTVFYTVHVIVSDPAGACMGIVNPRFTDSIIHLGPGEAMFLNTPSDSGQVYFWDFGDGTTSSVVGTNDHIYAANGTYTVCLTVYETDGSDTCQYCSEVTVTSLTAPGSCLGIVDPEFTDSTFYGDAYFYNAPSGSGQIYFWNFGDGTTSSVIGNNSHTYTADGTYTVCLTIYESDGSDTCQYCSDINISGISGCTAHFDVVQDSTDLFNFFVYNTSSVSGTPTYLWDFGDGTTSTLEYPSHTYSSPTPVLLCLTVSSGLLCSNTFCDSILPGVERTGEFTVHVVAPTGINEHDAINSTLENYPNPFSGTTSINYSISKDASVSISIVDLLGNTVIQLENGNKTGGNHSTTWNAENVASGMYLLQMKVNNAVSTKKIIVNK